MRGLLHILISFTLSVFFQIAPACSLTPGPRLNASYRSTNGDAIEFYTDGRIKFECSSENSDYCRLANRTACYDVNADLEIYIYCVADAHALFFTGLRFADAQRNQVLWYRFDHSYVMRYDRVE
ncbi:MAG: hypothetical protein KDK34_11830 [Leptospiraceae bacterium]|nr:hypothetical protein [Leptospiraceae bacterium]